ncbi:MAG: hypothetical protein GY946_23360 [bacterium]|nr:hypothetical protein [bacterium]
MRINTNDPPDAAVTALGKRFPFVMEPALLLLNGNGDILHVQYARLYPAFHINGVERSDWGEALLTVRELLALVDRVAREHETQNKRTVELLKREDPAAALALARIHVDRVRRESALAVLEGALKSAPDLDVREALADLCVIMGRTQRAQTEYERLLVQHPEHTRAPHWGYALARLVVEEAIDKGDVDRFADSRVAAARATLTSIGGNSANEPLALRSRLVLARVARSMGDVTGLKAHLDWLGARTGAQETCRSPWSPRMMMVLIGLECGAGPAFRAKSRDHMWQLVRTFPDSKQTQRAKHGMLDAMLQDPR